MTQQLYSPKMLGYWDDENLKEVPHENGIFCVFRAGPDEKSGEMDVKELLYVGESHNLQLRLLRNEDHPRWLSCLNPGEALWYSVSLTGHVNRERLLAALIHAHKPHLNDEYIDRFPFDETTVHITGKSRKLMDQFTVVRQE